MNQRGSVTIFTTLWLLVVFAVASLSVDGGYWYLTRMREQKAADGAALAGAIALAYAQAGASSISVAANAVATDNGFATSPTTIVTVHSPPDSGPYAGNGQAVAVTLSQPAQTFFSVAFGLIASPPTIAARAVALLNASPSPVCMLSLSGQFNIQSLSSVNSNGCSFGSNNPSSQSIYVANLSSLDVYGLVSAGGVCIYANGQCTTNGVQCYGADGTDCQEIVNVQTTVPAAQYQLPIEDPFASLQNLAVTPGTPQQINDYNWSAERTSNPIIYAGTYDQTLQIGGVSSASFCPGTYILEDGMSIGSLSSVQVIQKVQMATSGCPATTTDGVSFVVLGGTISVGSLSSISLNAPTNNADYPALSGILFYVEPSASHAAINFGNLSSADFSGGMYFPDAPVDIGSLSSSTVSDSDCHVVIAASISVSNLSSLTNSTTQSGCESAGTPLSHPQFVELVQ